MVRSNDGERLWEKRSGGLLLLAVITLTALGCVLFSSQLVTIAGKVLLPCPLLTLTGIRCPLCGGTRCFKALAGFDFAKAFYYNPLVIAITAILGCMYVRLALSCCMKKYTPYKPKISEKMMWAALVIFISFFVVRNMPFYKAWLY